ncbi:recombination protein O N-terminal domain-containing protein [Patescibacteria group bacterium]|nr:recombination protein O N-terminal domain-containing protein [Patescibacteria group bacterium]MBU1500654.1 recombination protein O N-terminal domain-containing protein [Patescibacteria group bacterium]MBU2080393.1 recombination protein O N-terminal domain-containing protein [Patescibacteria group bacterium]MBU2124195.1 recombination protein O N-terminal domain-containing protein [Patescibacteria group bacterium]MBU2194354.1 recombination protein O N-terminal domain-containing protein [Patesc
MRHKYVTEAIVLQRTPLAEAATLVTLLTEEFGLVRARAEGLRKPGAKLSSALQTLSHSEVTLMRGKHGWRLSGALLTKNWFQTLSPESRERAGRVGTLILRLVQGEGQGSLYDLYDEFLGKLQDSTEEEGDTAECIYALRILSELGLDTGDIPETDQKALSAQARRDVVMRINRGITASGL